MQSPEKSVHALGLLALALAKRGFRIFPLVVGGRTPAISGWIAKATTNSGQILAWWRERNFNIGIATGPELRIANGAGPAKYLVVIDYDMKEGQEGQKWLDQHVFLGLCDTLTVKTPHGVHKYYLVDREVLISDSIPNSVSRIAKNVDVRGARGYVVGPGSIVDGVTYQWDDKFQSFGMMALPEEFAAAARTDVNVHSHAHDLPPIGELDTPAAIQRTKAYLINDAPEAIQGQGGDLTTYMVAARCKDLGVSEIECFDLMSRYWNEEKASPVWPLEELRTKVENAYHYGRSPPGAAAPENEFEFETTEDGPADSSTIPLVSAFPIDPSTIPPRDWIVPGLLLKRNVSLLVAPPGSGKSLLTLQIAIMIATGMDWGGWRTRKRCKVLVVNSEDDMDEMRRRLFATALEMGVEQASLEGRVFLAEAPESIVIARLRAGTRSVVRTPLVDKLVKTIKDNEIGCVVVDPFAETFEGDENSNSEVKWAGVLWREVSRRTDSALMLVHHSRKYADDMAGEADVTRGGGSLIGVARILCTLFTMTEAEAKTMGVPEEERTDYVRFDDAKANHSKRGAVKWFSKKTLTLENARDGVPGDEVGALSPWKPDLMEGITEVVLKDLIEQINAGVPNKHEKPSGSFFSPSASGRSNDRWVGYVLTKVLGCDDMRAKAILKDWTVKGWIETFKYVDPGQRRERDGVRCDAAKWPHDATSPKER
jgi:KaiC/GvpD/RAD55 family RecA-like ATPase